MHTVSFERYQRDHMDLTALCDDNGGGTAGSEHLLDHDSKATNRQRVCKSWKLQSAYTGSYFYNIRFKRR